LARSGAHEFFGRAGIDRPHEGGPGWPRPTVPIKQAWPGPRPPKGESPARLHHSGGVSEGTLCPAEAGARGPAPDHGKRKARFQPWARGMLTHEGPGPRSGGEVGKPTFFWEVKSVVVVKKGKIREEETSREEFAKTPPTLGAGRLGKGPAVFCGKTWGRRAGKQSGSFPSTRDRFGTKTRKSPPEGKRPAGPRPAKLGQRIRRGLRSQAVPVVFAPFKQARRHEAGKTGPAGPQGTGPWARVPQVREPEFRAEAGFAAAEPSLGTLSQEGGPPARQGPRGRPEAGGPVLIRKDRRPAQFPIGPLRGSGGPGPHQAGGPNGRKTKSRPNSWAP